MKKFFGMIVCVILLLFIISCSDSTQEKPKPSEPKFETKKVLVTLGDYCVTKEEFLDRLDVIILSNEIMKRKEGKKMEEK